MSTFNLSNLSTKLITFLGSSMYSKLFSLLLWCLPLYHVFFVTFPLSIGFHVQKRLKGLMKFQKTIYVNLGIQWYSKYRRFDPINPKSIAQTLDTCIETSPAKSSWCNGEFINKLGSLVQAHKTENTIHSGVGMQRNT